MKIPLDILSKAITEYRSEGKELMIRLGRKFGYDISAPEEYEEFIWKGNPEVPRSGKLSERVNYAFHGGECGFHKRKTQQNIEVVLSNPPEFGKIDSWFLKSFLDSTAEYKELSKETSWEDLKPMLRQLYNSGVIKEIE
jgi:hypothetical protein